VIAYGAWPARATELPFRAPHMSYFSIVRWMALLLLVSACGARSQLDAPECHALATTACRQLSVQIPRTLLADDMPRWPRFVPHGDGVDLVITGATPGTKATAHRVRVLDTIFDVGAPVVLDDLTDCTLAATRNRLGAQCADVTLYDDSYDLVSQSQAEPSNVSRELDTFAATSSTFQVAWVATGLAAAFSAVDESGAVTSIPSPFGGGPFGEAMVTTTTCDTVVRGAVSVEGSLDVQLQAGVVSVPVPTLFHDIGIKEWPFARDAVVFAFAARDASDETLVLVDESGGRVLTQIPTEGKLILAMIPMPWGLAVIRVGVQGLNPPQSVTIDVLVVDAKGNITAALTLPTIPSVVGGGDWVRTGNTVVIGWGEPTGTYATAIECAE